MKTKILLLFLLGWAGIVLGQEKITKETLYQELKKDGNKISDDIYNPINFTNITERMPTEEGKARRYIWNPWSSVDYIKKGSNIYIEFLKEYIDVLGDECDIQILAYLQRKDKTIKPLAVSGFTKVITNTDNIESFKQNSLDLTLSKDITYRYSITKEESMKKSYSGEIKLVEENIDEEDKIIIYIQNAKASNTGFTQTFIYDDFGWKRGPSGGFSFVKITKPGFTEFSPAASLGYSFRYQPRKSSSFLGHFFSPSFGPILHVFQNGNDTTIGAGINASTFYNMVSIGFGATINGVNHGKPYIALGLNFIEGYNTLTGLIKK